MELIEQRRHIGLSRDLARAIPQLQHLSDQLEADGMATGIWKDGEYYLIGNSHTDDTPEEVVFVLTKRLWRKRLRKIPFTHRERLSAAMLAKRLYPTLWTLSEQHGR